MSALQSPVAAYYDQNTTPFLRWFGSGFEAAAIHRQVWGPGVRSGREAFEYLNALTASLAQLADLPAGADVLDLGCGLGGTASWVAERYAVNVTGLTVSSFQAMFANERAAKRGLGRRCRFLWGDFLHLPDFGPFRAAWAIESFAHALDAERFFDEVTRVLMPGARLVICDDFLAQAEPANTEAARCLDEFREGWRLGNLITVAETKELAARCGWRLAQHIDLTPYLRPAPAWFLGLAGQALRLPLRGEYARSLRGSLALQRCLRAGWTQYHALAWEKNQRLRNFLTHQSSISNLQLSTLMSSHTMNHYTVAVKRDFIAQHFLVGGDWGAENVRHSHHYVLELQLEGDRLDRHGYLVDIVDIERNLDALVAQYRDRTLNDLPEFAGLNPSIEHFARILCQTLAERIHAETLTAVTVKLWENEIAWAAYRQMIND